MIPKATASRSGASQPSAASAATKSNSTRQRGCYTCTDRCASLSKLEEIIPRNKHTFYLKVISSLCLCEIVYLGMSPNTFDILTWCLGSASTPLSDRKGEWVLPNGANFFVLAMIVAMIVISMIVESDRTMIVGKYDRDLGNPVGTLRVRSEQSPS